MLSLVTIVGCCCFTPLAEPCVLTLRATLFPGSLLLAAPTRPFRYRSGRACSASPCVGSRKSNHRFKLSRVISGCPSPGPATGCTFVYTGATLRATLICSFRRKYAESKVYIITRLVYGLACSGSSSGTAPCGVYGQAVVHVGGAGTPRDDPSGDNLMCKACTHILLIYTALWVLHRGLSMICWGDCTLYKTE
jgi:hypothetical protein